MVPSCGPTDTQPWSSHGRQPRVPRGSAAVPCPTPPLPTPPATLCRPDGGQPVATTVYKLHDSSHRPDAITPLTKAGQLAYPPQEGRRLLGFHLHLTSAVEVRRLHSPDSTPAVPAVRQAGDDSSLPNPTSTPPPTSNHQTRPLYPDSRLTPPRLHRRRSTSTTSNTHAARSL